MRLANKLYSGILAMLGFSACNPFSNITPDDVVMYGIPSTNFRIMGVVTADEKPVEGIRITVQTTYQDSPHTVVSVQSGVGGKYVANWTAFSPTGLTLLVEDIDGEDNGGEFAAQTKEISMADDAWELTDGAMTAEINFELIKKSEQ